MQTRRALLSTALAAPALVRLGRQVAAGRDLKISHQFPGGSEEEGDFRDRLCRKFAAALRQRSEGALTATVYPNASLMKTNAQFAALRKGALDLSLFPLAYAGGQLPELNIGLMACVVGSYAQGAAWKTAPVGRKLAAFLAEKGIVIVAWVWQANGVVSRANPIVVPEDVRGLKTRGGSREMDILLLAAGAATLPLPSNEIYAAMQTGVVDAVVTSSTSMISFRLEETGKHLTTARDRTFLFTFEPLLMSKAIFDSLTSGERDLIMAAGAELEPFGTAGSKADEDKVVEVFRKAGVQAQEIDKTAFEKWLALARTSTWKDYAGRSAEAAELLKLSQDIQA
ncbi:TRAP transporter substrate-binding protein DctP [Methylobacterium brachiatum]|uniref:TRAP transporter substrate-binding protein DctP n=1 Tax=Methylobacterium brachiatum TaxID=269660 RepID=UPI001E299E70|nr:TRAP transporter substrate-binding protein DctP [Methylobacterium brachiatum]MCB4806174.1 TRAP transporter substrate-binding protein DctP [Methylobacterium brachiatum]